MENKYFICECGFDFESITNWNCWDKIDKEIICPHCKQKYLVEYDVIEDENCSDKWGLKKIKIS